MLTLPDGISFGAYLVTQPIENPVIASHVHQSMENDLDNSPERASGIRDTSLTGIVDCGTWLNKIPL